MRRAGASGEGAQHRLVDEIGELAVVGDERNARLRAHYGQLRSHRLVALGHSGMTAQTKTHIEPTHAGAGTGLALIQLGAIIPGLLPTLALAGLLGVVILLPILVLGLLVGALAAPPYLLWRLARRRASPRHARAQGLVIGPTSGPRRVTPDSAT